MNDFILQHIKCPLCNGKIIIGEGKPRISAKVNELIRQEYNVVRCVDCCYFFVAPPITFSESEWKALYGESYFGLESDWSYRQKKRDIKKRLNFLKKCHKGDIKTYLDIGCGEGFTLIQGAELGWQVFGIDICDSRIEAAQLCRHEFIEGNLFTHRFPNSFFDCIYIDQVLEHLTDPLPYIQEIHRIMRPGALVYIGVPNEVCLFNSVKGLILLITGKGEISKYIDPFRSPYHVGGFSKRALKSFSDRNGFNVVQLRSVGGAGEFLKFPAFSRPFFLHLFMLPVQLAANLLGRKLYLEIILSK